MLLSKPVIKLTKNDPIWLVSHPRTMPIVYEMSTLFFLSLIKCTTFVCLFVFFSCFFCFVIYIVKSNWWSITNAAF